MVVDPALRRVEEKRDLMSKLDGLDQTDRQEIVFRENSPDRKKTTIYSTLSGEPLEMPLYQAKNALNKLSGGKPMFTSDPALAPAYKLGTLKCFLHAESPEHPFLEEIGLGAALYEELLCWVWLKGYAIRLGHWITNRKPRTNISAQSGRKLPNIILHLLLFFL